MPPHVGVWWALLDDDPESFGPGGPGDPASRGVGCRSPSCRPTITTQSLHPKHRVSTNPTMSGLHDGSFFRSSVLFLQPGRGVIRAGGWSKGGLRSVQYSVPAANTQGVGGSLRNGKAERSHLLEACRIYADVARQKTRTGGPVVLRFCNFDSRGVPVMSSSDRFRDQT